MGIGLACVWPGRREDSSKFRLALACAAAANIPDLDFAAGFLLHGDPHIYHQTYTHGLIFGLLCGLALTWVLPSRFDNAGVTWAVVLAALSHSVVDFVTGPEIGLYPSFGAPLLTPLVDTRLSAPITLFQGPHHGTLDHLVSTHNLRVMLQEIVILAPLCVAAVHFSGKKFRNNPT